MRPLRCATLALSLLSIAVAGALPARAEDARTLDRVIVQASRLQGVDAFDTPASLDRIDLRAEADRAGVNLSEFLGRVPGLSARDRQNHAQDTQLSIRGFGARSTFGVRGVRLYADGMPATMPDGQGQLSHFNLMGGEHVEVLRGPFSALYGNSSGGVVQLVSAQGQAPGEVAVRAGMGSGDSRQLAARVLGAQGRWDYNVAASVFDTEGYRDHSAARRESVNVKVGVGLPDDGRLQAVFNHFNLPQAQDPLGLTRTQWQANPRQAVAGATAFNTRKSVRQDQLGLTLDQPLGGDGHRVQATAYGGTRTVEQFLPLPVATQSNPLNSGGVIHLDNDYGGLDVRWAWQGEWAGQPIEATVGISGDRQDQHRRGYENFNGDRLGVRGRLRRDERNRVENFDQYAQWWWRWNDRWSLLAGVRRSRVSFSSHDGYVTGNNPDDSGRVHHGRTTPVAGIVFAPSETWRLYYSFGTGFETPTFNELAYRADGGAGLALDLHAAVSRHQEFGGKWRRGENELALALFRADTDDELAVVGNLGGRSTYRNVGRARRQGVEASFIGAIDDHWQWQASWTWLDAEFRDGFLTCARSGCAHPDAPVAAGTRIPGTAQQQAFARLQWQATGWQAAIEGTATSAIHVNDLGSERAPGYGLLHLEAGHRWRGRDADLRVFVRVDNALDRRYAGSVIVNESNGRYYEPGTDRSWWLGVEWKASR